MEASALLECLPEYDIVVPPVWTLEVSNALLVAERRKRTAETQTEHWIDLLTGLQCEVDIGLADISCREITTLARATHLSAYDASYLALASRLHAPLATMDVNLRRAAKDIGVAVLSR
ncbi:MAG: type II toxin-antitoxin system VapC family toxin [Patescibacteria group bacterium]